MYVFNPSERGLPKPVQVAMFIDRNRFVVGNREDSLRLIARVQIFDLEALPGLENDELDPVESSGG